MLPFSASEFSGLSANLFCLTRYFQGFWDFDKQPSRGFFLSSDLDYPRRVSMNVIFSSHLAIRLSSSWPSMFQNLPLWPQSGLSTFPICPYKASAFSGSRKCADRLFFCTHRYDEVASTFIIVIHGYYTDIAKECIVCTACCCEGREWEGETSAEVVEIATTSAGSPLGAQRRHNGGNGGNQPAELGNSFSLEKLTSKSFLSMW